MEKLNDILRLICRILLVAVKAMDSPSVIVPWKALSSEALGEENSVRIKNALRMIEKGGLLEVGQGKTGFIVRLDLAGLEWLEKHRHLLGNSDRD